MNISALFTPIFTFFSLMASGMLIGKIKLKNIQLGHAGVLGASLLLGLLSGHIPTLSIASLLPYCSFLSSLGTAIFISVIGLHTGCVFSQAKHRKLWKAFFGGCTVVLIGASITALLLCIDSFIPADLLNGIFAGAMTSTPTLSMVQEFFGPNSMSAVGYGMSYVIGVLSIVLFVQLIPCSQCTPTIYECSAKKRSISQNNTLLLLALCAILGSFIGWILPIGNTGGYLFSGVLIGWFCEKKNHLIQDTSLLKQLGLTIFLIGTGFPAGIQLTNELPARGLLYGMFISIGSILIGYLALRYLFHYSISDTLTILCGGMTSTPAIGILQQKNTKTDLSIYTMAYTGALVSLLTLIQLLLHI